MHVHLRICTFQVRVTRKQKGFLFFPFCWSSPECQWMRRTACRQAATGWSWRRWACRGSRWRGRVRCRSPVWPRHPGSSGCPLAPPLSPLRPRPRCRTSWCRSRGLRGPGNALRWRVELDPEKWTSLEDLEINCFVFANVAHQSTWLHLKGFLTLWCSTGVHFCSVLLPTFKTHRSNRCSRLKDSSKKKTRKTFL